MKKILPLLLFVFIGLFLVYFFVLRDRMGGLPDFSVPKDRIGKVYIVNKKGDHVTLSLNENKEWILDSTYPVRESMMDKLLYDLSEQKAVGEVPKSYRKNVKKALELAYTKVEVWNRNNEIIKVFYLGDPVPSNRGNYMVMDGDTKMYDVRLMDQYRNMSYDYSVKPESWRSFWIWDYTPEEIAQVEIHYLDTPSNSFVLKNNPPQYTIDGEPHISAAINFHRAESYFDLFEELPYEKVANEWTDKEELIQEKTKIAEIILGLKNGTDRTLVLYQFPLFNRDEKIPNSVDPERVVVLYPQEEQMYVAQRLSFGRILKSYKTFFYR